MKNTDIAQRMLQCAEEMESRALYRLYTFSEIVVFLILSKPVI